MLRLARTAGDRTPDIAVSVARTGAMFANDQARSSRTVDDRGLPLPGRGGGGAAYRTFNPELDTAASATKV